MRKGAAPAPNIRCYLRFGGSSRASRPQQPIPLCDAHLSRLVRRAEARGSWFLRWRLLILASPRAPNILRNHPGWVFNRNTQKCLRSAFIRITVIYMDSTSLSRQLEMNMNAIHFVMERLGSEATEQDAEQVIELAEQLAAEQGDEAFSAIDWLANRTYAWTRLWEAANGDAAALAEVRAEAQLPVIS